MSKTKILRRLFMVLVLGVLAVQAGAPLSAATAVGMPAPAFPIADVQSMRSLVSIENLTYGPFTTLGFAKDTYDKLLIVSEASGILRSADIPALDGGTITIRQGFVMDLQNTFRDVLDGTSHTIRGRTDGEIYLTIQEGEDITLRFNGYYRSLLEDIDNDGYIDTITLAVDAAGGEMFQKLDLDLVGQIDLGSREISALGGQGSFLTYISPFPSA